MTFFRWTVVTSRASQPQTDKNSNRRDRYLRRTYGLSLEDYNRILEDQNGGCWICGKTPEEEGKSLAVDHVHTGPDKGKCRGALCFRCNHLVVGRHRKDIGSVELLRKAADYLDREYYPFEAPERKKKRKKRGKRKQKR